MSVEVATFTYHEVTDDPSSSGFQRASALPYKHTCRAFSRDLDAIAAAGRIPATVNELDLAIPGRHLLLTFDDGGVSALHISDALLSRGWKGHFLITTGKLGTRAFLDAASVRALRAAGHVIGTHSHSHPNVFRELTPAAMRDEWRESRDRLEQILGERVEVASVPGGDTSPLVEQSADAVGIRWLFTSTPKLRPERIGTCMVLGRVCAKATTPSATLHRLAAFRGWRHAWLEWWLKDQIRVALKPIYLRWAHARTPEYPNQG